MATSTHRVDVVKVQLEPHPNADTLAVVRVFGFTVCVRAADWQGRTLGAYIQPDSVVDTTRPEFAFLAQPGRTRERIKVRRLRGVVSMGLLIAAPEGAKEGDDVAAQLGVTRYEPPVQASTGGEVAPAPPGYRPTFDVESWRRYAALFVPGEPVVVTEKIHGASGRYAFVDGALHVGSRTEWKVKGDSLWWVASDHDPSIERFCRAHPGATLYGEIYGNVQDLKYGVPRGGAPRFIAFDVLGADGAWLDPAAARAACVEAGVAFVPELFAGPYDPKAVEALAEGPSVMPGAGHLREGCVVRPARERTHPDIGRVMLKIVGNGYLERA